MTNLDWRQRHKPNLSLDLESLAHSLCSFIMPSTGIPLLMACASTCIIF